MNTSLLHTILFTIRHTKTDIVGWYPKIIALHIARSLWVFEFNSDDDGWDCYHKGIWQGYVSHDSMETIKDRLVEGLLS